MEVRILFTLVTGTVAAFLRVETGHQNVHIEGRDSYFGYYTRVSFENLTCAEAVSIHCLAPLTGAEEIDLFYTQCDSDAWQVAHYSNTKEVFFLKDQIWAKQFSVTSRQPLSIVDIQVQPCSSQKATNLLECPKENKRRHRSHRINGALRVHESELNLRRKRSTSESTRSFILENSPYLISDNITISADESVVIEPGVRIRFQPNTGIFVYGTLHANGTNEHPIYLEPAANTRWMGVLVSSHAASQSSFVYVNVSSSEMGITVRDSATFPYFDHVISDGNLNGFTFDVTKNEVNDQPLRVFKASAVNNKQNGFHIYGKAPIFLDACLAASNHENGFYIEGTSSVLLTNSHSFSNNGDGILVNSTNNLNINNSLFGANAANGVRIVRGGLPVTDLISIKFLGMNVTGHYYNPADSYMTCMITSAIHVETTDWKRRRNFGLLIDECSNMDIYMSSCHIYDNSNGGLTIGGQSADCEVRVIHGNWTRNRGPTLFMKNQASGIFLVEENFFTENHLNIYTDRESLLSVAAAEKTTIVISNNQFTKNTMESVLKLSQVGETSPKVAVTKNNFYANLAFNVIYAGASNANITQNYFNNVQSNCEITSGAEREPFIEDVKQNYWSLPTESEILSRVCAIRADDTQSALYLPFAELTNFTMSPSLTANQPIQPFDNLYNTIKDNGRCYMSKSDLIIPEGKVVILEPGVHIQFAPGASLIVEGKLYINGTDGKPIRLTGVDQNSWNGLVIKSGSTAVLSDLAISDASTGVLADSEKVHWERVKIERPVVHGIVLGPNSGPDIDFADSTVEKAFDNAVLVQKRERDISIRNLQIIENSGSGIHFDHPSHKVEVDNVRIENGNAYGIHIEEQDHGQLNTVKMQNLSIVNQSQGQAGVLFTGSAQLFEVLNGRFEGNSVPGIVAVFKCERRGSIFRAKGNTFARSRATPLSVTLGQCAAAEIEGNVFYGNNLDADLSALSVETSPKDKNSASSTLFINANKFVENTGKNTVKIGAGSEKAFPGLLSNNQFDGNVNTEAVVSTNSQYVKVSANDFSDPKSPKEIIFGGEGKLSVSDNSWGALETEDDARGRISCGSKECGESTIDILPIRLSTGTEAHSGVSSLSPCPKQCSGKGVCRADGTCICAAGYSGDDCSATVSPVCTVDCNGHGRCIGSTCQCYPGWSEPFCQLPLCPLLNNCTGNGICTGLNICTCNEGYAGLDCSIELCSKRNCVNGECKSGSCVCHSGWTSFSCTVPTCSGNCSFNGECTAPNECRCFDDYKGPTCNECVTAECRGCDPPCAHGECDTMTRTCSCAEGWTGAACDVCPSSACTSRPSILFVLPQTLEIGETNKIINVYGMEFPKDTSYKCIFGAMISQGVWRSSSLVRCSVPQGMLPGRHVFSLMPESDLHIIQSIDNKPIHFTFSMPCLSTCDGACVGPLCVCPIGKSGIDCSTIELVPNVDRQFIENEKANEAHEGVIYNVHVPVMPLSVVRMNSTAQGMQYDAARNFIEWDNPIGSSKPYNVSLTVWSLSGESDFSWALKVPPSYNATVEGVEQLGKTNRRRIHGTISKPLANMPVVLEVRRTDESLESFTVYTDKNGRFFHDYTPQNDYGHKYTVVARHPAEDSNSLESDVQLSWMASKVDVVYDERVTLNQLRQGIEYAVENTGETELSGWRIQVAKGNLRINKVEQSSPSIEPGQVNRIIAFFDVPDDLSGDVQMILASDQGVTYITRQETPARRQPKQFSSVPATLILPTIKDRLPVVEIHLDTESMSFSSPLTISSDQKPDPFMILGAYPSLSEFQKYSNSKTGINIALEVLPGQNYRNGSLQVFYRTDIILRIPYAFSERESELFNLAVCVKDEDYNSVLSTAANAQIELTNNHNVDVTNTRGTIVNGSPQIFTMAPGYYQLKVTSSSHLPYEEIIHAVPSNSSFCVHLTSNNNNIRGIYDGDKIYMGKLDVKKNSSIPTLLFEPSSLHPKAKELEVVVDGPQGKNDVIIDQLEHPLISIDKSDIALSVGDASRLEISVKDPNTVSSYANFVGSTTKCDSFLVPIPYRISRNNSETPLDRTAPVIVSGKENPTKLCDENFDRVPLARRTHVLCNCAAGARSRCSKSYHGSVACGGGWSRIADDTVSLENLAMILHLIAECSRVHVNMRELRQSMACISALDSECPAPARYKRSASFYYDSKKKKSRILNEEEMGNGIRKAANRSTQRTKPKPAMGEISFQLDPSLNPLINTLDLQSIGIASLFIDFIDKLEDLVPLDELKGFSSDFWNSFFTSISDKSSIGMGISGEEKNTILDGVTGSDVAANFLTRWNNTVREWTSGKIRPFEAKYGKMDLITYSQAQLLIASADRLKALSRQHGASDPFALLHSYMGRVLSTSSGDSSECLTADVVVDPVTVDEDHFFTIAIHVTNAKEIDIEGVELNVDLARENAYTAEVKFGKGLFSYTGIGALDGSRSLGRGASFKADLRLVVASTLPLTRPVNYQPLVVISFKYNGRTNVQKLNADMMTILPRKTLKLFYFVYPRVNTSEDPSTPYTALVSFINSGYVPLKNVKVIDTSIFIEGSKATPLAYRIHDISIYGKPVQGTIKYDVGDIASGKSKSVTYKMTTIKEPGLLRSMQLQAEVDGQLLPLKDSQTFAVKQTLSEGLLVSPLQSDQPTFYFNPTSANIVNVIQLQNTKMTPSNGQSEGRPYTQIQAAFTNPESSAMSGSLWGDIPLPQLPTNYKLIRMSEVGARLGPPTRVVAGPKWTTVENGNTFWVTHLHFIDSAALLPLPSNNINYEITFADPNQFSQPTFQQNDYRIQIFPESWPNAGSIIGTIDANSPIDSPLHYSLYSTNGDQQYSIDSETGEIYAEEQPRKNEEVCLTAEVRDDKGQVTRVPVAINTGGIRHPCVVADTTKLQPLVHGGTATTARDTTVTVTTQSSPTTASTEINTESEAMSTVSSTVSPSAEAASAWPSEKASTIQQSPSTDGSWTLPTETTETPPETTIHITHPHTVLTTLRTTQEELQTTTQYIHSVGPDTGPVSVTTEATVMTEVITTASEPEVTTWMTSPDVEPPTEPPTTVVETTEVPTTSSEELPTTIHEIRPDSTPQTIVFTVTTEKPSEPVTLISTEAMASSITYATDGQSEGSTNLPPVTTEASVETTSEYIYTIFSDSTLEPYTTQATIQSEATTPSIQTASSELTSTTINEGSGGTWNTGGEVPLITGRWSTQGIATDTSTSSTRWSSSATTRSPVSEETFETEPLLSTTMSPTEEYIQKACANRGAQAIWALICDLGSLTAPRVDRHQMKLRTQPDDTMKQELEGIHENDQLRKRN